MQCFSLTLTHTSLPFGLNGQLKRTQPVGHGSSLSSSRCDFDLVSIPVVCLTCCWLQDLTLGWNSNTRTSDREKNKNKNKSCYCHVCLVSTETEFLSFTCVLMLFSLSGPTICCCSNSCWNSSRWNRWASAPLNSACSATDLLFFTCSLSPTNIHWSFKGAFSLRLLPVGAERGWRPVLHFTDVPKSETLRTRCSPFSLHLEVHLLYV